MSEKDNADTHRVFIKDDVEAWIVATVKEKSKTEAICKISNGDERIVKLKDFKKSELPRVNEEVVADLVDMKYLHEPGVLTNLISRFEDGKPYTRSRDVVISMNPFRWLEHLYSLANQMYYASKIVWQISQDDPRQGLEPHIYEVSSLSFAELAFRGNNQSILITGESGSGKTEAAKLIMHHIATIQQGPMKETSSENVKPTTNVKCSIEFSDVVDRILHSNPLLEAFGNALTAQNENSSRFGKYVQLQFDKGDAALASYRTRSQPNCILVGSLCEIYLLETSRVCIHASNERSYHIFYQLLAASDEQKSSIWNGIVGKTASDFKYIGNPITEKIDGVSDNIKFNKTLSGFTRLGIPESDTATLLKAICLVLQLGNVEFSVDPNCDDKTVLSTSEDFLLVSNLLGINVDILLLAFTERTMTTRNETFKVPLSVSSACEARDALAKDIYLRSFNWLVDTMNSKTCAQRKQRETDAHTDFGIIGILDIFGFESFAINRFEQLCINYANEKLQQKAINDIFSAVRDEYEFEGIPLDLVEVVSNEELLHVFESRTGLMALLNEESYLPKGNNKSFTAKVLENFKSSSHVLSPPAGISNQFGIAHYAGDVLYTTDNFLVGNQDTLPFDLKRCVSNSSNPIVAGIQSQSKNSSNMCKNELIESTKQPTTFGNTDNINDSIGSKSECNPKNLSIGKKWELTQLKSKESQFECKLPRNDEPNSLLVSKSNDIKKQLRVINLLKNRPLTHKSPKTQTSHCDVMAASVWTKYRAQLASLVERLSDTHSRYVRCIKPNKSLSPMMSDRNMIVKQLRYTGIVSTVKLSQAIFTNSISNKILSTKYRFLWNKQKYPSKAKRIDSNEARRRLECIALLECALEFFVYTKDIEPMFAVGKTRSYFRQGVLEFLEAKRLLELERFATIIQRKFREMQLRSKAKLEKFATIIQRRYREMKCRSKTISVVTSARIIQLWYHKRKLAKLQKMSNSAVLIQSICRCLLTKKHIVRIIAASTIQLWYRRIKLEVAKKKLQRFRQIYQNR